MERQDANVQAYSPGVTAASLLRGEIEPPSWASGLIKTIESCTRMPGNHPWVDDRASSTGYVFSGVGSTTHGTPKSRSEKRKKRQPSFPPRSWGRSTSSGSYFKPEVDNRPPLENADQSQQVHKANESLTTAQFETRFDSGSDPFADNPQPASTSGTGLNPETVDKFSASETPQSSSISPLTHHKSISISFPSSSFIPQGLTTSNSIRRHDKGSPGLLRSNSYGGSYKPFLQPKPELLQSLSPHEGVARAIALYDFQAIEVLSAQPWSTLTEFVAISPETCHWRKEM